MDDEAHAVEVAAHVAVGHGAEDLFEHRFERGCGDAEGGAGVDFLDDGEVAVRKGVQAKTADGAGGAGFAGENGFTVFDGEGDDLVRRNGFEGFEQFSGADGHDPLRLYSAFIVSWIAAEVGFGADLVDEVAGGEFDDVASFAQENVLDDEDGVATLNDAGDVLQGCEYLALFGLYE